MTRAVNDATLQKAGDIYQYLIALRDCFELNDGDTLQIETNGDVSIINDVGGRFQREVKHHFGNTSISDRDIDFWKTLANWYVDYERVKNFPKDKITTLEQKKFVASIREIKYDKMIPNAMSDYWKADLTVAKYFRDNLMYLESLESYMEDLSAKMQYSKANSDLNAEGATEEGQIRISKQLYNGVMSWDANDFGSIIRNQGYFQRGVIHNIVDETDFKWKVGEEKNEHK